MMLFCTCNNTSPFRSAETFQFQDEKYVSCENDTFFFAVHKRNGNPFIEIHCEECGMNVAIPIPSES